VAIHCVPFLQFIQSPQLRVSDYSDGQVSFQPLEIAYPPFPTRNVVKYQNTIAEETFPSFGRKLKET
jgi:hypothetical protein